MACGLILAKGEDTEDGLLTADEVMWLDGRSWRLVVLSACRTAIGADIPGQGLASLRRAFHIAGAQRVISSCWNVSDEATQRLMTLFYQNLLKRRLTPAAALRAAQLKMLRSKEFSAPKYWGAFISSGSPE